MADKFHEVVESLKNSSPENDFLIISHTVDGKLYSEVTRQINQGKSSEKLTVFLTTYGGDPHRGFRLARCLRHNYKYVRIVIPSYCKSAGTLIAISADEIAIGDTGELGPLDIQVSKPNEIQETSSGLDVMQALEALKAHSIEAFRAALLDLRLGAKISTKLAGEMAAKLAIGFAQPLYGQIDPIKLGELQRAMKIANDYGRKLDAYTKNLKEGALSKLISAYPSHAFVIDRKEAKELFEKVSTPTVQESSFCDMIWDSLEYETGSVYFIEGKKIGVEDATPNETGDVESVSGSEVTTVGRPVSEPSDGKPKKRGVRVRQRSA